MLTAKKFDPTVILKDQCLQDTNLLITGAGSGLGAALAFAAASYGALVVLSGRNKKNLELVYDKIVDKGYQEPIILQCDLKNLSPESSADFYQVLSEHVDRLDGIVFNAAMFNGLQPLLQQQPLEFLETLHVNLVSPLLLMQSLSGLLKGATSASIVFTGDDINSVSKAYWGGYGVSKIALEGLAAIAADELENSSIRVNVVYPGVVQTNLRNRAYHAEDPRQLKSPEDSVAMFIYLLSAQSESITACKFSE